MNLAVDTANPAAVKPALHAGCHEFLNSQLCARNLCDGFRVRHVADDDPLVQSLQLRTNGEESASCDEDPVNLRYFANAKQN